MLKEWHTRCSQCSFHFLLCYTKLLEVTHICECDSISITINYSNHCLFSLQANKSGQALLDAVFRQLDLVETSYFGLRYLDEDNQPVSNKSSFIWQYWSNSYSNMKVNQCEHSFPFKHAPLFQKSYFIIWNHNHCSDEQIATYIRRLRARLTVHYCHLKKTYTHSLAREVN